MHGTFPSLIKMGDYYVVELLFVFTIILGKNVRLVLLRGYDIRPIIFYLLRGKGSSKVAKCSKTKSAFRDICIKIRMELVLPQGPKLSL